MFSSALNPSLDEITWNQVYHFNFLNWFKLYIWEQIIRKHSFKNVSMDKKRHITPFIYISRELQGDS